MKHALSSLILSLGLLAPALASAQELGRKGDAIFSVDRLMGISAGHRVIANPPGDAVDDWTDVSLAWRGGAIATPFEVPRFAFDYLVIDHLSIGGSLGWASLSHDGTNNSVAMFLLAPRVGYLYSFGRVVGIWPRAGFTYHSSSVNNGDHESGFALDLECPFTFSPAQHFAFHIGPTFDVDLFGNLNHPNPVPDVDNKYRSIGINGGILGWF
jgi:hypothetical protein